MTMKGIICGTGYAGLLSGGELTATDISTPFGDAEVHLGSGRFEDLAFISRFRAEISDVVEEQHRERLVVPPHRVNYRANLLALFELGVERVVALSAVGGLVESVPPGAIVLVDQLIDFTQGRKETFFDGGEWGTAYTDVTEPYCRELRGNILGLAEAHNVEIQPSGVYVAFRGPRFETAAEIRMFAGFGGTVVGMTSAPEATLARELGIHFSLICTSVNNAAGLDGATIKFSRTEQAGKTQSVRELTIAALRAEAVGDCTCSTATRIDHEPTAWNPHR